MSGKRPFDTHIIKSQRGISAYEIQRKTEIHIQSGLCYGNNHLRYFNHSVSNTAVIGI